MFHLKNIAILALQMASSGNQHCVSCIGTLSFPVIAGVVKTPRTSLQQKTRHVLSKPDYKSITSGHFIFRWDQSLRPYK